MDDLRQTQRKAPGNEKTLKRKIEDLTSFMVRKHYCENDTKALIDLIEEPFSWIGAGEQEYAVGAENVISAFRQFSGKVPSCIVSDEHYDAVPIGEGIWLCSGHYRVQTDPSTETFLRVHQRITAVFRMKDDGSFCCSHIHISNPYSEMNDTDIGFPTQMANDSREYLREQIAAQKKLIDRQTQRLMQLSFRDTMTGLYNRNKFNQEMHKRTRREEKSLPLGVAYFDLNGLKEENDRFGHEAGDKLIIRTADHINRSFGDKTYRIGGDEFVVIDRESDERQFVSLIETVRENLKLDGISVSVGVRWRAGGGNITEQFHEADRLMYEEKHRFYRD